MIAWIAAAFLVLPPTVLVRPLVARAFASNNQNGSTPINCISLLLGPVLFLVAFSLWGRILPNYGWSFVAALGSIGLLSALMRRGTSTNFVSNDGFLLAFLLLVFGVSFLLRTYWPAIHWENSVERLGVERLFNLSIQQSFLYSTAWPPNNLWLNGEPLHYHLLLRAAPGLASWIARTCFDSPLTGGMLYLIFDAWYLCLAPFAVAVWGYVLIPNGELIRQDPITSLKRRRVLCLLLGLLTFVAPHGAALIAGIKSILFGEVVDFWNIQHEVVKGTVNFFPFGLLLSGESHSYAQAPFLQVTLWGAVMWQISQPLSWARSLLTGIIAAALAMAHPASAFLAVCALSPVAVVVGFRALRNGALTPLLKSFSISAISALLLYLPEALNWRAPDTRWVFVQESLASPAAPFISAQLAPITTVMMLLIACAAFSSALTVIKREIISILSLAIAIAITLIYNRLAIGIAIFIFATLIAAAAKFKNLGPTALFPFPLGLGIIWILPELVVSDWAIDNRTDWVRFNTVMRFWLEGYYLIPMVAVALLGCRVIDSTRRFRFLTASFSILLVVNTIAIIPFVQNRITRTPEAPSNDGFKFMTVEHRSDWWIVEYLSKLQGPVVLGEICGTGTSPLTPQHYGMPGRISAFSGRPAVCGWGRHTWMFQPTFQHGPLTGQAVWSSFLEYERALTIIYSQEESPELERARNLIRARGITHLVIGELEVRVFGMVQLDKVAKRVNGKIVAQTQPGNGVIELL